MGYGWRVSIVGGCLNECFAGCSDQEVEGDVVWIEIRRLWGESRKSGGPRWAYLINYLATSVQAQAMAGQSGQPRILAECKIRCRMGLRQIQSASDYLKAWEMSFLWEMCPRGGINRARENAGQRNRRVEIVSARMCSYLAVSKHDILFGYGTLLLHIYSSKTR